METPEVDVVSVEVSQVVEALIDRLVLLEGRIEVLERTQTAYREALFLLGSAANCQLAILKAMTIPITETPAVDPKPTKRVVN